MSEVFLEVKGIKKYFGGVKALKGVDLRINKGEVHCLAGENGCGKSTLIKVISGAHAADAGEIYIEGKEYAGLTPMEAIHAGIQVIYQDFSVFPNLTVAENIALNSELQAGRKKVNWKQVAKIAEEAMAKIGANIDPTLLVERLSVANKQMVAICRALLNNAKLIIMDEPTTALTAMEVERLFNIIHGLTQKGIAVLIVNHKLDEVYGIAQKLTIFRNGENVASGNICEFDRDRFIECMTGREIATGYYKPKTSQKEIFSVDGLSREGVFEDVSFVLRENDILGITGLLGSGRGEIGEALFGIAPPTGGTIKMDGKAISIKSVADSMANGIGYVPEDRLTQGLFLEQSIGMNIIISAIKKYRRGVNLNGKRMDDDMHAWIKKLNVAAPSPYPPMRTLSGGNQQKVVLAKWLNSDPRVLILNGPTVGVDVGSKADIHMILRNLASQGIGVIIISDDLPELVQNCNNIIVMRNGRPAASLNTAEIDEDRLSAVLKEQY